MTSTPLALIRFMIPWMLELRKLSDPSFITRRYIPTTCGSRRRTSRAMKSFRVVFESTIDWISVCGTWS